jgi:NAD(P)-dependent dehydrogenase (short-subunit alcohol dehydrogenase family)
MARVLIVTGGSRGIGAAVSRLAANDGWDACVNYVAHAERAGEVVDSVRACGRRAIAVAADVSREKDVWRSLPPVKTRSAHRPAWSTTPGSSRALGGSTISGTITCVAPSRSIRSRISFARAKR